MFLYFSRPYADWFALILFLGAAITDWFDGYLARAWKQESRFGAMLDPIADKTMVVVALMVIVGYSSMSPWLVLPATIILIREIMVSGLREYLGRETSSLRVMPLAKWKTTAQMLAIAILFAQGIFEHYLLIAAAGLEPTVVSEILLGQGVDQNGLFWKSAGMKWSGFIGHWMLWLAAALTLITGFGYLRSAIPHLRESS